jgi:conjugation system TraG family ATPase
MHKKLQFKEPFIGTSDESGITLLYSADGNFSSILSIENLALQYNADPEIYDEFHTLLGQIVKLLGSSYILQKTDIIATQQYKPAISEHTDYLQRKYFEHYNGRAYKSITTYITITKTNNKSRFFSYDAKDIKDFVSKINKVVDALQNHKIKTSVLNKQHIENLQRRFVSFNFNNDNCFVGNVLSDSNALYFGEKQLKIVSLIDIDELNIPAQIGTHGTKPEIGKNFPVDNFSFLLNVPSADTILYNQVIFIPDQIKTKRDLEAKRKKHSSMPDAANKISVEDIDSMFLDIAAENELLVFCNFSLLVYGDTMVLDKAINNIESNLFSMGIIPGKNTYNQMELFRAAIPGNANEMQEYDKFLTSRPAATCFFFMERLPKTEESDYLLYLTDRQGVPIGIDTSELPWQQNRIFNRNKFVLGPSGSGKSFSTNTYVFLCHLMGADVVLVDTGHSYKGTCKYLNGRYITYTEDRPITMNPFRIEEIESNEEKRQILKSLIGMLWKGADGILSQVEDTIISKIITDYFIDYFTKKKVVKSLSFNTFYEYSCSQIEEIIKLEDIHFNLKEYRFILKKFYRGGEYDKILNDDFDNSLFNESFIVFEIDSIKEHKLLFPITTLIIMDVFLQKMRYKSNKKILCIEEAWKAIASPMMAGYIVYLFKTVRKFNGEVMVVTQEINDIVGNAIVKDSIIANSDTIFLLDQSKFKENFHQVQSLLSINEVERNKLFTVNRLENKEGRSRFKELYIRRGSTGEVYGIELPVEQYLTFSTERVERETLEVYLDYYTGYENAMDHLVSDMKESGLSLSSFCRTVSKRKTVYNLKAIAV